MPRCGWVRTDRTDSQTMTPQSPTERALSVELAKTISERNILLRKVDELRIRLINDGGCCPDCLTNSWAPCDPKTDGAYIVGGVASMCEYCDLTKRYEALRVCLKESVDEAEQV